MLMNLGKSIKKIRTIKGMTQADVAEKLHITAEAYSKIENGKTKLDTSRLEELAKIYGVSVQDIYNFDDKKIFINHSPAAINRAFVQNDNTELLNLLKEIIQEKNTLIADQKIEIQALKKTIADLNAQK
jgi:transcriptional regulator with XRE-family HTH domain